MNLNAFEMEFLFLFVADDDNNDMLRYKKLSKVVCMIVHSSSLLKHINPMIF